MKIIFISVMISGGRITSSPQVSVSDIYKFNTETLSWEFVGYMTIPRMGFGMSILNKDDIMEYCLE